MSHQDKRNHKIKSDYGRADYYKHYCKKVDKPVSKERFYAILDDYLNEIHNMISQEGYEYDMPCRIGKIQFRKYKSEVKLSNDGKVINNLPINWKATNKLWEENPNAKEKKILVRHVNKHTGGYTYTLRYIKYNATYKNKTAYKMFINREMRRKTQGPIVQNKIDAFIIK